MAGKRITFQRLYLQGFGPYHDAVEIYFSPGTNNLVAENEKGKSTLAAGLTAVIFGLPAISDPTKFGLACYRNWDQPPSCTGELDFAVNDEQFLIKRDFDTNQVCLAKLGPGGEIETILAEGTHNPNAKRPHPEYEQRLKEIFGLLSKELFVSTFYLTQPLPEPKGLSHEVQKLLSGGGVDFAGVLKTLEKELKEWTKYTADLGVTSRNLQKDRELEVITQKIDSLIDHMEKDRQVVDSLEEVQEELQKVEEQSAEAQMEWRQKRQVLEAWTEWKRLRDGYQSALREYKQILRACEEAEKIQQENSAVMTLLKKEFPEFEDADEETGRCLEELSIMEEKKKSYKGDLAGQERFLQEKKKEQARLEEELKNFPRWEELGADPPGQVRVLQKNAATCLQEWAVFQDRLGKVDCKKSLLASRYSLFQQAGPDEREVVGHYSKISGERKSALQEAEEKLERAQAKRKGYAQVLHAFKEKFQDFEQEISDEASAKQMIDAAHQKLAFQERESALEKKALQLKKRLTPSLTLRLFCAASLAALSLVGVFEGLSELFLQVVAVLAGGLAGYWGAGLFPILLNTKVKGELRSTVGKLVVCREELNGLNQELGGFASAGPAQLGALLEKMKQYLAEKTRLEAMKSGLPNIAELAGLEAGFQQAALEYQRFLGVTEKITAVFSDVEEAFSQWRNLLEEKDRIWQKAERYAAETFHCTPSQVFKADPLGEEVAELWQETAYYLQIFFPEGEYTTVAGLLALLEKTDPSVWGKLETKAQEYAAVVNGIQKLGTELETANFQKKEQEKRLLMFEKEIDSFVVGLQEILVGAGGDLQQARERWETCQRFRNEFRIKNAALQVILKQHQITGLEKLFDKKNEAELQTREHFARWKNHIDKYPGLPRIEEKEDIGGIIKSMEVLSGDAQALEERCLKLQKKWETIRERQLQLQGRDLINIAQAEIELTALKKKKEAAELLSEAIALAHAELTAAIADYQGSYLQHLEEHATKYYRMITRNAARNITFDANFNLQVKEGGRNCEITQLSKGAQDQLYLALRFAVADLLAENFKLPFIFDDPFVSTDDGRLEIIRNILDQAASERQFAVLSHSEAFSCWGIPVEIMFNSETEKFLRQA